MFKVGCSGFPVKRGTYDFAYRTFNNASVVMQKSLYIFCHSGPDPESSLSGLDSRLRGNDGLGIHVKKP